MKGIGYPYPKKIAPRGVCLDVHRVGEQGAGNTGSTNTYKGPKTPKEPIMKDTKVISVRMPESLLATLDELSKIEAEKIGKASAVSVNISRSAIVNQLIELGIECWKEAQDG